MTNSNLVSYFQIDHNRYKLIFELDSEINIELSDPTFEESAGDIIMLNEKPDYIKTYKDNPISRNTPTKRAWADKQASHSA